MYGANSDAGAPNLQSYSRDISADVGMPKQWCLIRCCAMLICL